MTANTDGYGRASNRATRRRRRWPWVLLIVAVVLAALCVVVDRASAKVAENKLVPVVSNAAQDQGFDPKHTSVDIQGFPFLSQVARGDLRSVHVHMSDVETNSLTVDALDATFHQISFPRDILTGSDPHDVTAQRANGYLAVDPARIQRAAQIDGLSLSTKSDSLRATLPVTYQGVSVTLAGRVGASVEGNQVAFSLHDVSAGGITVPAQVVEHFTSGFHPVLNVPHLPFDLSVDRLGAGDGKARLYVSARDVPLVR